MIFKCSECNYVVPHGVAVDLNKEQDKYVCPKCSHLASIRNSKKYNKDDLSKNIVGNQYAHLTIDAVARSKANHTIEQQKAICQFMIDKYTTRNKDQYKDDIVKARFYLDWMGELK